MMNKNENQLFLKENPTLSDIQTYVTELEKERGFEDQNIVQKCLMLGEEVGELFKAVRKQEKLKTDPQSKVGTVAEELADITIYVCAIANRLGINLEQALRDKEEVNKRRKWQ